MKRVVVLVLALAVLAGLGYGGYRRFGAPPPTPTPEPEPTEVVIWATGRVVPALRASLSFAVGGTVAGVPVREGDAVERGDLLALLNSSALETAVTQAEAGLELARARRDQVAGGAAAADIAAAGEVVRAAEAEAAAAEARRSGAEADLARARAELRRAAAAHGDVVAGPTENELRLAQIELDMARDRLYGAQAARDTIGGALDRDQARRSDYDTAQAAVLEAEDAVRAAEIHLQDVTAGPSASERTAANSSVGVAQAAVDAAAAQVSALAAQRDAALARAQEAAGRLESLEAGPTSAAMRVAEAEVRQATVQLQAAREALEQTRISAPFDGTIGGIDVMASEVVVPGQAVVTLGDLTRLRVETTDLRETDLPRISDGQDVEITFDSLPELRLPGRIERIAPMASQDQGGSNYTVWVDFVETDPRVRWGMTAYVNIRVAN
jgi:multidrug efflux pump subunit AcrA (membrane-fusion protein)